MRSDAILPQAIDSMLCVLLCGLYMGMASICSFFKERLLSTEKKDAETRDFFSREVQNDHL